MGKNEVIPLLLPREKQTWFNHISHLYILIIVMFKKKKATGKDQEENIDEYLSELMVWKNLQVLKTL